MNEIPAPKFAYPAKCPQSLIRRLVEMAADAATVFAIDASRDGVIITDQAVRYLCGAICAGLTVAAHDTLHRSAKLLADPEIQQWLANNPPTPE